MKFSSCQINPEQVRLLLFKECDRRGRKLLFDSSSIQKVPAGKGDEPNVRQNEVPRVVEVSHGFTYWYKGSSADVSILGEMTFGAVAMNYKNVSLKIHIMDEPRRLMCTKVFCVPSRRVSGVERSSERHEINGSDLRDSSKSLSVPLVREEVALSFSLGRGDSGYYGDHSSYSSVGSDYLPLFETSESQDDFNYFHELSGRRLSTCSNSSWQRRTLQNMATRFDFGNSSLNLLSQSSASNLGNSSDSQMYCSSASGTNESIGSTGSLVVHRKAKLGLALLISVADHNQIDIVRRCLEHSPQLQSLVARLRLATLTAGVSSGFVSTLHRAAEDAAKWLSDLVYGPRLQSMWLNLVTSNVKSSGKLAESLLSDICQVLSVGDTKSTNFFISTLLTHILTYHLSWVATVSPYDTSDHQLRQDLSAHTRKPYNALWAQLSDLCGSIGFPPRATKTIISGATNTHFLNRLLVVITYFVRCGNVIYNEFQYENGVHKEIKVTNVMPEQLGLKRTATYVGKLEQCDLDNRKTPSVNTQNSDISVRTLVASDVNLMRSSTLANLSEKLSNSSEFVRDCSSISEKPLAGLRRNRTMISLKASLESGINSLVSEEIEPEQKVLFVLGDDDKLVGLKKKSVDGKHVKKSSKMYNDSSSLGNQPKTLETCTKEGDDVKRAESPSKCCGQTLQHSKPIKHSGFKFEFEKYPQIVTNYMKSKNLEILDRHYIGKPGNLKLDNFQFDPTVVPPIQEERCDACVKCQMMESMLQTPTNASEMEYMNDMPRQVELQYAKETIVDDETNHWKISPKTFVRQRKENTLVVNVNNSVIDDLKCVPNVKAVEVRKASREKDKGRDKTVEVKRVLEFTGVRLRGGPSAAQQPGFDASLLGGLTDHYVPDLILQGTTAKPSTWEAELRRDLDLASYLNKTTDSPTPVQAVAIIGDTNTWEVRVVGRDCGTSGMSSLVGAMLDALPAMRRARVPAHQCISFVEAKLRELCVLSKTLADMLMTTDFCDMATLTKSLNVDANDVPLLLAVATTHTPQVAARYGVSYR